MSARELLEVTQLAVVVWVIWQLLNAAKTQFRRRVWPRWDAECEVLHRLRQLVDLLEERRGAPKPADRQAWCDDPLCWRREPDHQHST